MKCRSYSIVRAYAKCSDCEWDAAIVINPSSSMNKLMAQIKTHVEKEGHRVLLEKVYLSQYSPE